MINPFLGFEAYLGYAWLIAGLILLILEVGTPGLFFFLSLACGSFIAAGIAFLGACWYTQCWTAVIGTLVSFLLLKHLFTKKKYLQKTNIDALVGQEAMVIETVEPRKTGRVKVKGEEWPAVSDFQTILQKGTVVKILRIDGNKLVVR